MRSSVMLSNETTQKNIYFFFSFRNRTLSTSIRPPSKFESSAWMSFEQTRECRFESFLFCFVPPFFSHMHAWEAWTRFVRGRACASISEFKWLAKISKWQIGTERAPFVVDDVRQPKKWKNERSMKTVAVCRKRTATKVSTLCFLVFVKLKLLVDSKSATPSAKPQSTLEIVYLLNSSNKPSNLALEALVGS